MRILLIDDDDVLLALLEVVLAGDGITIETAVGGDAGLAAFARCEPDLVILDVVMPDRSGWDVLRQLRETSDVAVMLLSGRADELDKVRGFELGADDYVTKPFSIAELEARVHALLRRAHATRRREVVDAHG